MALRPNRVCRMRHTRATSTPTLHCCLCFLNLGLCIPSHALLPTRQQRITQEKANAMSAVMIQLLRSGIEMLCFIFACFCCVANVCIELQLGAHARNFAVGCSAVRSGESSCFFCPSRDRTSPSAYLHHSINLLDSRCMFSGVLQYLLTRTPAA